MKNFFLVCITLLALMSTLVGCLKPAPKVEPWQLTFNTPTVFGEVQTDSQKNSSIIATKEYDKPGVSPTPDLPRVMPTLRKDPVDYLVQQGDSLSVIARNYGVDVNALLLANEITNPNILEVGQALVIPTVDPNLKPVDFKIIPDSELVYSPSSIGFDCSSFLSQFSGYLSSLDYSEEVVMQVAEEYSVNPRILLTAFEYQTGWLRS